MKRGTKRIRPKKRTPSEFARIYGSKARVAWVQRQFCMNCGKHASALRWIVNAHTENGGTSRKADAETIVPLCETLARDGCHDLQHDHGWSRLRRLDTPEKRQAAAAETQNCWLAYQARKSA